MLRVYAEDGVGEHVRVRVHVRVGVRVVALQRVDRREHLVLDEVREDEVDGRFVRDALRHARADEVRVRVRRLGGSGDVRQHRASTGRRGPYQGRVQDVVADPGARLRRGA